MNASRHLQLLTVAFRSELEARSIVLERERSGNVDCCLIREALMSGVGSHEERISRQAAIIKVMATLDGAVESRPTGATARSYIGHKFLASKY